MQSETVWFQANKYHVPRLAYINKLDRMGADFEDCIKQMREKLLVTAAICTIPVGLSGDFQGVIDLMRMKFIKRDPTDKTNVKYDLVDIPASHQADAKHYREQLLDVASHADDEMVELILEGKDVPEEVLIGLAQRHARRQVHTDLLRVVQEFSRRAAAARRGRGFLAISDGPAAGRRHRPQEQGKGLGGSRRRKSRSPGWHSRPLPNRRATSSTSALLRQDGSRAKTT